MNTNHNIEFLLSKFSHEIRNPLTSIYSTLQLIELKHPEAISFPYWTNLSYDIEYINHLLDDFSNLAKSEQLTLEKIDLNSFLKQLSVAFAASIASSEVEYTIKIDSSTPQITGDKTKLQEVFWNLLKNAFDAAVPDNHIYFSVFPEKDTVVFLVEDTGQGIPEELLPTIFEPFITYKKDGTGLGLPICKQIIEAHGGTIQVQSLPGVRTTFRVCLKAE